MEAIVNNIEFDLYKTLYLIKTNDDLLTVYDMGISDSLDETLFYIKNNSLSDDVYRYLHDIFSSIILVEEKYLSIYNSINHSYEAPKQIEVTFDIFKTLHMIKSNKDLLEVFNMEVLIDIQTVITTAKNSLLSDKTLEYIKGLYGIIVDNESYLEQYLKLTNNIAPVQVELTEEEFQIPRRYGRKRILLDIENQNGISTNAQLASLENNRLKNLYALIDRRLIKKMLNNDNKLSDEDCIKISLEIKSFEKKIINIIKKK